MLKYIAHSVERDFVRGFHYKLGTIFIDGWRVVGSDGKGDCDDFALTVAFKLAGENWFRFALNVITFKSTFWLVYSPQNKWGIPRHIVLWHKGKGWIDSSKREWRDTPSPHSRRLPIPFPWVFVRAFWGGLYELVF